MKYSKQRELILKYVQSSCEHPTADMVYSNIKKDIPNISLGTVYRNLNQLCEAGLLRKITMPNNSDRFDKTLMDHCHLYCNKCGVVFDIDFNIINNVNDLIEKQTGHIVETNNIVLTGICNDCSKKL
jgi:Fur family peroxide stress response transcriptional regulator